MGISEQQVLKTLIYSVLLPTIFFLSCKSEHKDNYERFPLEPRLEFVSFEKMDNGTPIDDKAILKLHFTDGDGNVGLDSTDNKPPFDSLYYYNFFCVYHAKRNGEFIAFPEFGFNVRLPRFPINKVGDVDIVWMQNSRFLTNNLEPLGGEIKYVLHVQNSQLLMLIDSIWVPVPEVDTIMFECWLIDRDLNESNHVFTQAITVKNR